MDFDTRGQVVPRRPRRALLAVLASRPPSYPEAGTATSPYAWIQKVTITTARRSGL